MICLNAFCLKVVLLTSFMLLKLRRICSCFLLRCVDLGHCALLLSAWILSNILLFITFFVVIFDFVLYMIFSVVHFVTLEYVAYRFTYSSLNTYIILDRFPRTSTSIPIIDLTICRCSLTLYQLLVRVLT